MLLEKHTINCPKISQFEFGSWLYEVVFWFYFWNIGSSYLGVGGREIILYYFPHSTGQMLTDYKVKFNTKHNITINSCHQNYLVFIVLPDSVELISEEMKFSWNKRIKLGLTP